MPNLTLDQLYTQFSTEITNAHPTSSPSKKDKDFYTTKKLSEYISSQMNGVRNTCLNSKNPYMTFQIKFEHGSSQDLKNLKTNLGWTLVENIPFTQNVTDPDSEEHSKFYNWLRENRTRPYNGVAYKILGTVIAFENKDDAINFSQKFGFQISL